MFIPTEEDARALFEDAIYNAGIYLPTLDRQVYDIDDAVEEDECMVEAAFDNWLADQDVPPEAHDKWTAVD